jgi:hypothetical protein
MFVPEVPRLISALAVSAIVVPLEIYVAIDFLTASAIVIFPTLETLEAGA